MKPSSSHSLTERSSLQTNRHSTKKEISKQLIWPYAKPEHQLSQVMPISLWPKKDLSAITSSDALPTSSHQHINSTENQLSQLLQSFQSTTLSLMSKESSVFPTLETEPEIGPIVEGMLKEILRPLEKSHRNSESNTIYKWLSSVERNFWSKDSDLCTLWVEEASMILFSSIWHIREIPIVMPGFHTLAREFALTQEDTTSSQVTIYLFSRGN